MVLAQPITVALGGSDCESWQSGLLHQPVNALSSLAYVVVGIWVATRPDDRSGRLRGGVYGAAVTAVGVGSFLYHGPQWPGSAVLHDAAIPAVLLFIAVDGVASLRGWPVRRQLTGYAAAFGAAGLLVALVPASGVPVAAATAALAAAAELARFRSGRQVPARSALVAAGAVLAAVLAGLAGRTGSPLCRPDSLLQGHALWHLLTAAALLRWYPIRRWGTA